MYTRKVTYKMLEHYSKHTCFFLEAYKLSFAIVAHKMQTAVGAFKLKNATNQTTFKEAET